jgi:hypothetical protein
MKIISVCQIIFSTFIGWDYLYLFLARTTPTEPATLLTPSPGTVFQTPLVVLGLTIFALSLVQLSKRFPLAVLQTACGVIITVVSAVWFFDARNHYYVSPAIHWPFYPAVAAALTSLIVGILQLRVKKETANKANSSETG